jgi:hypothetical protein
MSDPIRITTLMQIKLRIVAFLRSRIIQKLRNLKKSGVFFIEIRELFSGENRVQT